ncbi:MAG: hypothetical protein GVY26_17335 [Bacteroidetes bacterium]|jgi:hypothetical protein|nr:hypothetical protein [Bacteroidota bacterium]
MRYRLWGTTALFLLFQLALCAQQGRVTENFEQQPLTEVLERFEAAYGLRLAYDPAMLQGRSVSLQLQDEAVLPALFRVLDAAALEYRTVASDKILIRPRTESPFPPVKYLKLSGRLRDAGSGEVLPYASVQWAGEPIGACADANGRYELLLPDTLETAKLEARYIGYQPRTVLWQKRQPHTLDIALRPDTVNVPTVIVVERFPYLSQDKKAQSNTLRPQSQLPGLGGQLDPFRQLQLLPGIAAYNDFSTGLQVRGGMPDENLVEWDGMVLYNLDHFFGIFSAVDGQLVDQVKLYKNSFPAEYGGRISSVVAIASPKRHPDTTSGRMDLSNLMAGGHIDLPLGNDMSLLLGGRLTLPGLGNSSLFNAFEQQIEAPETETSLLLRDQVVRIRPNFSFYDGFAKYRWAIGEDTHLQAQYFQSEDRYDYIYGFQFRTFNQRRIILNDNTVSERATWNNQATSVRLEHRWNERWRSRWDVGYSQYDETEWTQTLLSRAPRGETPDEFETNNQRGNQLRAVHFKWVNDWRSDSTQHYQWGYRFSDEQTQLELLNDDSTLLNRQLEGQQHALFASGAYDLEQLYWSWALHATYYAPTASLHISPRIKATLPLGEQASLHLSASRYHQFLRRYYYENRFGRSVAVWTMADERAIPIAHANQFTLGGSWANGKWSFDAVGFYKYTEGSIQQAALIGGLGGEDDPRPQSMDFRIFQGEGQAYGLELLAQYEGKYFSNWLSYTLSRSLQRYPQAFRNDWFPTQEDRPHQLQWNGQYRRDQWSFNSTYVFASGAPFFDGSLLSALQERRLADPAAYQRIDDYHRLDLGLAYRFQWERMGLQLGASVYNLLDRPNTFYRQQFFGINLPEGTGPRRAAVVGNELVLLGRTLSLSLKLSW